MSKYKILTSRAKRLDGPDKVTGRAKYTADIDLGNMLYGAILHSPLAHARILNIDTARAKALAGVKAVFTADDVPHTPFGVSPARYDETLLCIDKVRYVGDEVAIVAADSAEAAREAAGLIQVDYEELPHVLDAHLALLPGAPLVHEKFAGNIMAEVHQEFGDVAAARKEADYIHRSKLDSKMQDGAFMEPQACIAQYDQRGYLTLTSSTQSPHYVQRTLAMVLGVPLGRVRVIKPSVGGGFGPKVACSTLELATCLLAMRTGRTVQMTFSREEVFLHSRARHQFFHEMETGVKKDGTLVFLKHKALLDGGAFSSFGIATVYYSGSLLGGPYKLPNMKYDGLRVFTNKPACGAQRGHGGVIARACFETQLDAIAEELGMDPIELRLKNMMKTGETTCNELNMSSLGMEECIRAVKERSGYQEKKGRLGKGRGIGMACGFFVSGAGYPIYRSKTSHATAIIKLAEVGQTVHLLTGAADIGQGSDTALAMIAAEALGTELDDIKVFSGDTDLALDLGAYSSRTTLMTGHAVKEAAESVKAQVLEVLAEELGIAREELSLELGLVQCANRELDISAIRREFIKEHRGFSDHPAEGPLTFKEASRLAFLKRGAIVGTGKYSPPPLGGSYKGAAVGTSPAYGCSAQIMEVTVDLETGEVQATKIVGAHDCGLAINRTQVEGQMQGSYSMGLGEGLMEEIRYDEKGRIVNANLAEYKIPTTLDMPETETIIVESNEPKGPFGAKEVGEGAIMPTIPALLNAIYDATGVRLTELPATPERIAMALREKMGKS